MEGRLALEGLYLALVQRGFPLTLRDLVDALTALRAGYGGCRRQDLLWLCKSLWARTEEEVRALELLFNQFVFPTDGEISARTGMPLERMTQMEARRAREPDRRSERQQLPSSSAPSLTFAAAGQAGVAVPRAVVPETAEESWVFTPHPAVSLRSMIVVWRRFRQPVRQGVGTDIDVEATADEQCRRGVLAEPVLATGRYNRARLVLLLDVSPSMAPWMNMTPLWRESLAHSRLGYAAIYYFHNVPGKVLYTQEELRLPVPLADALAACPGAALLLCSDAGAARGLRHRQRVEQVRQFLHDVRTHWEPVAWVNPMPRWRWPGSTAAHIARLPGLAMVPLTEDGLVEAVDVLRGKVVRGWS